MYSGVALFRAYLRRAAFLCDLMDDSTPYPFGDFLSALAPHIGPDPLIEKAVHSLPRDNGRAGAVRLMTSLLRWEKYSEEIVALGLEELIDLYEPMLLFFQRGQSFYRENGLVYIGTGGFSIGRPEVMKDYPILEIMDATYLDQLDTEEKIV